MEGKGAESQCEWRWCRTKLTVGKTQNATGSEKLGRSGELEGHEDTSVH
jgi:hypothetical protein